MTTPDYTSNADRVLDYLERHGELTELESERWEPPVRRLAARISDLQARGHVIENVAPHGQIARYVLRRARTLPIKAGSTPAPARPTCVRCGLTASETRPTTAPGFLQVRCPTHGWQPWRTAA